MIERGDYRASARTRAGGFTLLEVMVAVVVTAIGLLGIAKIQALAYASTTTSSVRSLVALQASGLAASMHANRTYWSTGAAPVLITITSSGTTSTISDNTLNTTATTSNFCYSGVVAPAVGCSTAQMAAFDLHTWANALNAPGMLFNLNPVTTIACPTINTPITCQITVTWNEKAVSVNSQGVSNTVVASGSAQNGTFQPTYILYVEP
jgi:type IV pilus assembly protein PilV